MNMWAKQRGFTIVELLIVIVVIAILAAITIVAYNGIQNRAKQSALSTSASQTGRKILAFAPLNGDQYPLESTFRSDLSLADDTEKLTYSYFTSTDRKTFCFSATDTTGATPSYAFTQTGSVVEGRCVKNYGINPGVESGSIAPWSGPNGSTVAIDTSRVNAGSYAARITMPTATGAGVVGGTAYNVSNAVNASNLKPNTVYTASLYVYVPSGTVNVYTSAQGSGVASVGGYTTATEKGNWTRIYRTFTTSTSGTVVLYILNSSAISTAGTQFWADSLVFTEGSTAYSVDTNQLSYWSWVDAANTSLSFGPATAQ